VTNSGGEERAPLNNLPLPKRELKRCAIVAAIELLAIFERAAVVDRNVIAGLRLARAFHRVRDIDCHLCSESGGREEAEEE
jgi:hypothetical protein